ncbi:VOC family protein [Isoptericola sp. BMS4]|uniref:VOC family protein n=1 Tax=Isoptericola sp. BMS4 TaxID=2527875 RepID=UPI0014231827|nr:VOC family protein [Isoptericola sp. BMS4]
MSLVTFKDLCIDATDAAAMGEFWARTLGLRAEALDDGDVVLRGDRPEQTVWINTVPEPKTVKHRVHLDVRARSLDDFAGVPQVSETGRFPWTTFADPDGGESCVFTYDDAPAYRLKDVVVACADHRVLGEFWHGLLGGVLSTDGEYSWLDESAGVPSESFESFDFVPVPEPKTVKNRVHWDVTLNDGVTLDDLVARGATVLRAQDDEIGWTVMADPEGNEFCVFRR